jgi:hypothetical protein
VLAHEAPRVWEADMQLYGVRKAWRQLHRKGLEVTRCNVTHDMRRQGRGAVRGKKLLLWLIG